MKQKVTLVNKEYPNASPRNATPTERRLKTRPPRQPNHQIVYKLSDLLEYMAKNNIGNS